MEGLLLFTRMPRRRILGNPGATTPRKAAGVQRRLPSGCTNPSCAQTYFYTRGNDDAEESNYCRLKKNNNAPLMTQMKPNLRVAALWR
jgi:hypothetical protein